MKIWRCPNCDEGIRAPKSMSKDDCRRFCLSCSGKQGTLVRRIMISSLSTKEKKQEARQQRQETIKKEQHLYPWCIKDDLKKIAKLICWTRRSVINSLGIHIHFDKRRKRAVAGYSRSKHILGLFPCARPELTYALVFWRLAQIDLGAYEGASPKSKDFYDLFLTAVSAFLGQPIDSSQPYGNAVEALKSYTSKLGIATMGNATVKRKAKVKVKKTKLEATFSARENKAKW